jgi:DNA-directed RNA polymerase I subunit RPA1
LLNAGLLEEAREVAGMLPKTSSTDADADDDDDEEVAATPKKKLGKTDKAESSRQAAQAASEWIVQIEDYTDTQLAAARKRGVGRDSYKDGLVFEERRKTLRDFFNLARPKKCTRCKA